VGVDIQHACFIATYSSRMADEISGICLRTPPRVISEITIRR
jgi:hypothetical protein